MKVQNGKRQTDQVGPVCVHQFQSSSSSSKSDFCAVAGLLAVGETTFGTNTSPKALPSRLSRSSKTSSRSEPPEFEERGSGEGRGEIGESVARKGLDETEMDVLDV